MDRTVHIWLNIPKKYRENKPKMSSNCPKFSNGHIYNFHASKLQLWAAIRIYRKSTSKRNAEGHQAFLYASHDADFWNVDLNGPYSRSIRYVVQRKATIRSVCRSTLKKCRDCMVPFFKTMSPNSYNKLGGCSQLPRHIQMKEPATNIMFYSGGSVLYPTYDM